MHLLHPMLKSLHTVKMHSTAPDVLACAACRSARNSQGGALAQQQNGAGAGAAAGMQNVVSAEEYRHRWRSASASAGQDLPREQPSIGLPDLLGCVAGPCLR
jgi:hypothetical protein